MQCTVRTAKDNTINPVFLDLTRRREGTEKNKKTEDCAMIQDTEAILEEFPCCPGHQPVQENSIGLNVDFSVSAFITLWLRVSV